MLHRNVEIQDRKIGRTRICLPFFLSNFRSSSSIDSKFSSVTFLSGKVGTRMVVCNLFCAVSEVLSRLFGVMVWEGDVRFVTLFMKQRSVDTYYDGTGALPRNQSNHKVLTTILTLTCAQKPGKRTRDSVKWCLCTTFYEGRNQHSNVTCEVFFLT